MIAAPLEALKRSGARVLEAARRKRSARIAEESSERLRVPGRHEALEATLGRSHRAPLGTPAMLGTSLLAAAILGWYYVRAYSRPTVSDAPARRAAELADSPLPPLQPAGPAVGAQESPTHPHYAIGDILDPTNAPGEKEAQAEDGNKERRLSSASGAAPQLPELRRMDGAVFARSSKPVESSASAVGTADLKNPGTGIAEANPLDRLLRSEITPAIAAAVLPTQRLLLPKGAFLDCTLETAIDSTLPGLTTCVTAFDTFGADGTVVLLERGTKLIGEMRSQVQQGAARVFVLWTEARTPNGIVVSLASPGTDELGRAGLAGTVDRHFAERFGAAILVSIVGGVAQGAVSRSQGNGGTVILNPSGAADVATEVLRGTLGIPPTVRVPQGERIEVLVARDLDFRSVYSLHAPASPGP